VNSLSRIFTMAPTINFRSSRLLTGADSVVTVWKTITMMIISFVVVAPTIVVAQDPQVGDQICAGGYIMDTFCIELGNLLDNGFIKTLEEPNKHSIHCLVDVGVCETSPYEVLMDPSPGLLYTRWYRVSENTLLRDLARSVGTCSTCTGQGNQVQGFRAEVTGTVTQARNGEVPPVIDVSEAKILSEGESPCGGAILPMTPAPTPAPTPDPTPDPTPAPTPLPTPAPTTALPSTIPTILMVPTISTNSMTPSLSPMPSEAESTSSMPSVTMTMGASLTSFPSVDVTQIQLFRKLRGRNP